MMWVTMRAVAEQLGLQISAAGFLKLPLLHGELDGQKVRARWGDRGSNVAALLDPPLDLGLEIGRMGLFGRILPAKLLLNDPNWDMEVDAVCDEPARGALLFAGDARRAVLGLNATSAYLSITDNSVGVLVQDTADGTLAQALQACARTAALIDKARRELPAATVVFEHGEALGRFARENRLSILRTPLVVWGPLRTVNVQVAFPRVGVEKHDARIRVTPAEGKLGEGLLVKRETAVDRVRTFFGGQDLQTGDAAFDPAFLVQAGEAERTVAALDEEVRSLLLDLRGRFDVVVLDESGLTLEGPVARVSPNEIVSLTEAACRVVERVARAIAGARQGPYR